MDSGNEIQYEFLPFIRTYRNGRVHRLIGTDQVPASLDPTTGVTSKDVEIQPEIGLSVRLFLPHLAANSPEKLPVLIYFHGGGFCVESASSPVYHHYCNILASQANVIVVSVDYRRPPEHPLPAAYDDSWAAIKWVASLSDEWLATRAAPGGICLAGDSAGANIAHHMALRAGTEDAGVSIEGVVLAHPYFWGSKPIGSELTDPEARRRLEGLWSFACPSRPSADDPLVNPLAEDAPSLAGLACGRVLVFVAEKDVLRERGHAYYEGLKASGWGGRAELLEAKGENHVFHLFNLRSPDSLVMMEQLASFLKS